MLPYSLEVSNVRGGARCRTFFFPCAKKETHVCSFEVWKRWDLGFLKKSLKKSSTSATAGATWPLRWRGSSERIGRRIVWDCLELSLNQMWCFRYICCVRRGERETDLFFYKKCLWYFWTFANGETIPRCWISRLLVKEFSQGNVVSLLKKKNTTTTTTTTNNNNNNMLWKFIFSFLELKPQQPFFKWKCRRLSSLYRQLCTWAQHSALTLASRQPLGPAASLEAVFVAFYITLDGRWRIF